MLPNQPTPVDHGWRPARKKGDHIFGCFARGGREKRVFRTGEKRNVSARETIISMDRVSTPGGGVSLVGKKARWARAAICGMGYENASTLGGYSVERGETRIDLFFEGKTDSHILVGREQRNSRERSWHWQLYLSGSPAGAKEKERAALIFAP